MFIHVILCNGSGSMFFLVLGVFMEYLILGTVGSLSSPCYISFLKARLWYEKLLLLVYGMSENIQPYLLLSMLYPTITNPQ